MGTIDSLRKSDVFWHFGVQIAPIMERFPSVKKFKKKNTIDYGAQMSE